MPIEIQIEDQTRTLEKLAGQLSDKKLNVANVRAINVAIRKSNTQYRRELVKNYNLKYGDTKEMVTPKRATYGTPTGTISGQMRPLSLSRFNPKFLKDGQVFSITSIKNKETGKRGLEQKAKKARKTDQLSGVSIEIKKGQRKIIPYAFMIQTDKPGIAQQIWARGSYQSNRFQKSGRRLPITPLKTTSPFGAMTTAPIQTEIRKGATSEMRKEFERQVNLLLKQAGAK